MSQSKFSDFLNFKVMITPVVILVLFWLGLVAIVIAAIELFARGNVLVGIGTVVLGPFAWRITCEYLIIGFRMHDCLEQIARNTQTEPVRRGDMSPKGHNTLRSGVPEQRPMGHGILVSEISVGEYYETTDGKAFKVVEFTRDGIRVEFAMGNVEIVPPIDSKVPEGLWAFDIRPTRNS
jgi:hypothetical protein